MSRPAPAEVADEVRRAARTRTIGWPPAPRARHMGLRPFVRNHASPGCRALDTRAAGWSVTGSAWFSPTSLSHPARSKVTP